MPACVSPAVALGSWGQLQRNSNPHPPKARVLFPHTFPEKTVVILIPFPIRRVALLRATNGALTALGTGLRAWHILPQLIRGVRTQNIIFQMTAQKMKSSFDSSYLV